MDTWKPFAAAAEKAIDCSVAEYALYKCPPYPLPAVQGKSSASSWNSTAPLLPRSFAAGKLLFLSKRRAPSMVLVPQDLLAVAMPASGFRACGSILITHGVARFVGAFVRNSTQQQLALASGRGCQGS